MSPEQTFQAFLDQQVVCGHVPDPDLQGSVSFGSGLGWLILAPRKVWVDMLAETRKDPYELSLEASVSGAAVKPRYFEVPQDMKKCSK